MSSRRKNRNKPHNQPQNGNGQGATHRFPEPPPQVNLSDVVNLWITDPPEPETAPPPPGNGSAHDGGETGYGKSRYNSMVDGLRARLIFPDAMSWAIDNRALAIAAQLQPRTKLEGWLMKEMARATVQIDVCFDQLLIDQKRVLDKIDLAWESDCTTRANKLGGRLDAQSYNTSQALAATKYGAVYLLNKWSELESAITTNSCLADAQMEIAYSLLGVDKVFRSGSRKLPASNDGPALLAVVAREKALLNRSLETRLNSLDLLERKAAEVGITRFQDAETRKLKSNESRARKRLEWAKKALDELRAGVCPSAIFDPEAGKPLDPEDHAAPVAEPAPAAPPPPPPPPDTSPPADSTPAESDPPSPNPGAHLISEGCPAEMRQILLLLGDAALRKYGPPTDEPGPPSA